MAASKKPTRETLSNFFRWCQTLLDYNFRCLLCHFETPFQKRQLMCQDHWPMHNEIKIDNLNEYIEKQQYDPHLTCESKCKILPRKKTLKPSSSNDGPPKPPPFRDDIQAHLHPATMLQRGRLCKPCETVEETDPTTTRRGSHATTKMRRQVNAPTRGRRQEKRWVPRVLKKAHN